VSAPREGLTAGQRLAFIVLGVLLGLAVGCFSDPGSPGAPGTGDAGTGDASSGAASSSETGSSGEGESSSGASGTSSSDSSGSTSSSEGTGSSSSSSSTSSTTGDDTTGGSTGGGVCLTQGNQCNVVIPDPPCCEGLVCSYTGSFTTCQPG
jgi:hypothetical protein